MVRPKHTRRDMNHARIVQELRDLGAYVADCADVGGEVPDLFVCWRGICRPVEVKQRGKERDLTEGEANCKWRTARAHTPLLVVTCIEDVLNAWAKLMKEGRQPCDDESF